MVALGIFGLIALGSWQVLNRVIDTQQRTTQSQQQLANLQKAMWFIARDFRGVIDRPIRNEYGEIEKAFTTEINGQAISFTRQGWPNPTHAPRSNMQRVAYKLDYLPEDESNRQWLIRSYWPVLDRAPSTEPIIQPLLPDIEFLDLEFVDSKGGIHTHWPPQQNTEVLKDIRAIPAGITLRLGTKDYGEIERVFALQNMEAIP